MDCFITTSLTCRTSLTKIRYFNRIIFTIFFFWWEFSFRIYCENLHLFHKSKSCCNFLSMFTKWNDPYLYNYWCARLRDLILFINHTKTSQNVYESAINIIVLETSTLRHQSLSKYVLVQKTIEILKNDKNDTTTIVILGGINCCDESVCLWEYILFYVIFNCSIKLNSRCTPLAKWGVQSLVRALAATLDALLFLKWLLMWIHVIAGLLMTAYQKFHCQKDA